MQRYNQGLLLLDCQTGNIGIESKWARVKVSSNSSTLKGFLLPVIGEATPEKLVNSMQQIEKQKRNNS